MYTRWEKPAHPTPTPQSPSPPPDTGITHSSSHALMENLSKFSIPADYKEVFVMLPGNKQWRRNSMPYP